MSAESGQGARATSDEVQPPRSHGNEVDVARPDTEARLRRTEAELRLRRGLEALVTSMSTRLFGVHLDELPSVVQEDLGELCTYFGVDRAYALKVDENFVFDLNVEWWGPDVAQRTTPVLELPMEAQRFWFRVLRSGDVVHIPDVDDADDALAGAVGALKHDGVRSILFLPLLARGATVGFLGLEARGSKCSWSDESIALVRTVGELFVSAVDRSRAEQALELAARELEQRNAELERSNQELEQFASIVSHDLKSPLQVLRGFVELLGRDAGKIPADEAQTYVKAALRGADRMNRLIDDLLAYSRAGHRPANYVPVDLNEVMREVVADSAAQSREADVLIDVKSLPSVAGDHTQLRQLLQNLLDNAVKFRRAGVTPEVSVSASEDNGWWKIRVQDNGVGVERPHREEIFRMFNRAHHRDRPGSGIGLAVCARVVANHGGNIWVEEGPTGGSAFCFTLSKDPAAAIDRR